MCRPSWPDLPLMLPCLAALAEAYQQLKSTMDHVEHCVMLLDMTLPGWQVLYCNQHWKTLTGVVCAAWLTLLVGVHLYCSRLPC